jgi:hypothetical protein
MSLESKMGTDEGNIVGFEEHYRTVFDTRARKRL